jgi:DNA-binding GntR family transcriptional regulator
LTAGRHRGGSWPTTCGTASARGSGPGRLPGEKTLAQEYGVALGTVRKALALLRDEGLIRTDKGWGSYVTGSKPPRNP